VRPEELRAEVSLLARHTYLDSAATSLKPRSVLDAQRAFYEEVGANVERGAHGLGSEATERFEAARAEVARLLDADPRGLALTRNATAAVSLLAHGLAGPEGPLADLGPGDTIVTSVYEHHSNLLPWQRLVARRGCRLVVAKPRGHVLDAACLDAPGRVRLVALQHASNVTGAVHPLRDLAREARRRHAGALVVADGAQAVGHGPLSLAELGVDAYAFSGHKGPLGPMGTGGLWARPELLARLEPSDLGGGTVHDVREQGYSLRAEAARRLEGGTPDVAGVIGLAAGARLLRRVGLARVQAHERALTARLRGGLRGLGARVEGPEGGVGVVSFNLPGWPCHDLAMALDKERIAVRSGHHCALPLARHLGVLDEHGGTVRASFHYYNTEDDVDALLAALRGLA
jgi:cysteine desulfurase/selenocysteine lyase